ncbi:MAG TPA: TfuA-like protein [Kofleriaceae bacterium]|nr:TfuA-like protein [Kofleriaceae bacterium]
MSVYVFLGPSLPVTEARAILDATYLPPVACGDVQCLLAANPRAIGIIDGLFDDRPAVFHKEILAALSAGVRVFGASSMGALRAAELHVFGMEGVGQIFEAFRSGALEDDDEVALVHGSSANSYIAYSDAMVNLREGLMRAARAGVITDATRDALTAIAKRTFYVQRTWRRLIADGQAAGLPVERLADYVARERPDLKRDDAMAMLRHMAVALATDQRPASAAFSFAHTAQWEQLITLVNHARGYGQKPSGEIPPRAFTLHARVHADPERTLAREALFLSLVEEIAAIRGVGATADEIARELKRRGLASKDLAGRTLARLEVLVRKLVAGTAPDKLGSYVPAVLARQGTLDELVDQVQQKWSWLLEQGLAHPALEQAGIGVDRLVRWYRRISGAREKSLDELAASLGIAVDELREEALREYLFAARRPPRRRLLRRKRKAARTTR